MCGFIPGNPILCDCEIAWLMLGRKYQRKIYGKCHNGTEFKDLDSNSMQDCSWECPYQCIKSLRLSLCTPGTVTFSHVGNCRPGELCCQPHVLKTTTIPSAPVQAISSGMWCGNWCLFFPTKKERTRNCKEIARSSFSFIRRFTWYVICLKGKLMCCRWQTN